MLKFGIILRPILSFAIGFVIGHTTSKIVKEKSQFNKGKCINCSTSLLVVTATIEGHRVYECPNCNYSVTVKHDFIDKGYTPEEVYNDVRI